MSLREHVTAGMKAAMKAGDRTRSSTLRLVMAAFKERDIEARGRGGPEAVADEAALVQVLAKLSKQREESARIYAGAGRAELAAQEEAELAIIRELMPQRLSDAEMDAAIAEAVAATGATSQRDMGKVLAALKQSHGASIDMAAASAKVKAALAG